MLKCRRITVLAVLITALSLLSLSPVANAAPSRLMKQKVIVATGSVTCKKVTGSIVFRPAVRHVGTTAETQVVTFRASACTTKGSNVRRVTSGQLTVTVHRPSNSCVDLLSTELPTGTGRWTPSSTHPTTASFSGLEFVDNKAGDVGFTVPNPGGTAHVTGSFAGTDHGRRSTATVYTNMTPLQFRDACLSAAGLSKQFIVSGVATFS
jgi:hypothetical protein